MKVLISKAKYEKPQYEAKCGLVIICTPMANNQKMRIYEKDGKTYIDIPFKTGHFSRVEINHVEEKVKILGNG